MRRLGALAAVVVAAAVVGGCGGSGSKSSKSSKTLPTQSTATGATTAPTFSGAGSARFCELVRTYRDRLAGLTGPSSTPAQRRQFGQELGPAIRQAVAVAPAEIKADVTLVAGAATDYLAALEKAGYDFGKVPPDALERFQAPDVMAASSRLEAYSRNVCGISS
jgi:hypothetical protein